jgi:PAS domain S-box-containing protein
VTVDVEELAAPAAISEDARVVECDRALEARVADELRERLDASEASFRALVEQMPHAVMVHGPADDDFGIRYVNRALLAMLGYADATELLGRSSLDMFVHPDDRAWLPELRRRRAAGEPLPPAHVRWIARNGQIREVRAVSSPTTFDGRPATLVHAQDVTEQMKLERARAETETALRRSEERYRLLFDAMPLPAWMIDPVTLQLLAVNDAMVRTHGYTREELLAMPVTQLKVQDEVPAMIGGIARGRTNTHHVGVRKHRRKDGQLLSIDITVQPVELDGRRAILGVGTDVTQSVKLEEQLRQAQKMEAVGQLAGGIAHDFNNILGVIATNVDLALESIGADHAAREDIEEIASAATRAAALVRQLLAFSRKQPRELKRVALNSVVTGIEAMLSRIVGEDIRMSALLAPQLAAIEADVSQLEQVLVNLVVNARDAMPSGGALALETANVTLDEAEAGALGVAAGRYVRLSVCDTGCGMDESTRKHAFEPFFTTKDVGKGTGLGLATVFGIVKQSGGGIALDSSPGQGSTFRIYFPAVSALPHADVAAAREPVLRGCETVLVVEDDVQLRSALRRQLTSLGYSVLEAPDGRNALAMAERHAGRIDLLLTDLVMPGMDGRTLGDRLLAHNPRAKVVYMSGHTEHPALQRIELRPHDHFMQKPFTARTLSETVRRAFRGEQR